MMKNRISTTVRTSGLRVQYRRLSAVLAAGVLAAALAGCSGAPGPSITVPVETAPPIPAVPFPTLASTPPELWPEDFKGGGNEPPPMQEAENLDPAEWDDASIDGAKSKAMEVMRLFARPGMGADQWKEEIFPLATLKLQLNFLSVQPQYLPVSEVRGKPYLHLDEFNPYQAPVIVDSNLGQWQVLLRRTGQDAPWLADTVEPIYKDVNGPRM